MSSSATAEISPKTEPQNATASDDANPTPTPTSASATENGTATAAGEDTKATTVESAVEQAKRAFALQKYEEAVDHYATALEIVTQQAGENAPETADLYFSYGRALLENAISQNSVLGKEQPEEALEEEKASGSGSGKNGPILSFSGDGDDPVVDLGAEPEEDSDDEDGDDDKGEPEDDFNAAWEVLDLARAIYEKQLEGEEDEEVRLKLADTFIALGDVSLETEKFDQAISDYQCGLDLKLKLLPISSRHIAEAHYKLSMVLDLTSGRLADAISHVEKALESVEHRLAELRNGLQGQHTPAPPPQEEPKVDVKGKGKRVAKLIRDDLVQNMSKTQIENEIKELEGLKTDLALKIEELKTSPSEQQKETAPELAAKALDSELNGASSAAPAVVNDLTSIVKKKKKNPSAEPATNGKRKAEDTADLESSSSEKKVRLDTADS